MKNKIVWYALVDRVPEDAAGEPRFYPSLYSPAEQDAGKTCRQVDTFEVDEADVPNEVFRLRYYPLRTVHKDGTIAEEFDDLTSARLSQPGNPEVRTKTGLKIWPW
jgi:hypothetical protein